MTKIEVVREGDVAEETEIMNMMITMMIDGRVIGGVQMNMLMGPALLPRTTEMENEAVGSRRLLDEDDRFFFSSGSSYRFLLPRFPFMSGLGTLQRFVAFIYPISSYLAVPYTFNNSGDTLSEQTFALVVGSVCIWNTWIC